MRGILCFLLLLLLGNAQALSTRNVKNLEPVLGAQLSFRKESDVARQGREASNQPFPSFIDLAFEAFGSSFAFELQVYSEITDGAKISLFGENGALLGEKPFQHKVYRGEKFNELGEKIGWINLVAHEDGLFDALVFIDDELYVIDPLVEHEADLDAQSKRDLVAASDLVIYKDSDLLDAGRLSGSVSNPSTSDAVTLVEPQGKINRNLLTVTKWTDCFPNPLVTRRFDVAFYADRGFYAAVGATAAKAEEAILSIVSKSNVIYYNQVNVFLFPGRVIVQTAANGDAFNQKRGSCTPIEATLESFRVWRSKQADEEDGTYHLLTDCYPTGMVGLSNTAVLCSKSQGVGLSSYTSFTTWRTVARELGHNFGANNTYQKGQGTTGGIMDSGDGKLNGHYQFNSKYSKDMVCAEITASMNETGPDHVKNCWKDFAPKCGNGMVEPGEDCDDDSYCCQSCKFIAGGQCSSGSCCQNCQFAPSTTTCGEEGYCANGICTPSTCATIDNLLFCGIKPDNRCRQTCSLSNSTDCLRLESYGLTSGNVANGVVCDTAPYSTCQNGNCIPVTTPIWVTGNWSTCSLPCGEESMNRTVSCSQNGTIVADSQCSGTKPAFNASCKNPTCESLVFTWVSVAGPCDLATCTQNNTVSCQLSGGKVVADSYCSSYAASPAKPPLTSACSKCSTSNSILTNSTLWIAVGAGGGGLLLLILLILLLVFCRKKKKNPDEEGAGKDSAAAAAAGGMVAKDAAAAAAAKAPPEELEPSSPISSGPGALEDEPAPAPVPAPRSYLPSLMGFLSSNVPPPNKPPPPPPNKPVPPPPNKY